MKKAKFNQLENGQAIMLARDVRAIRPSPDIVVKQGTTGTFMAHATVPIKGHGDRFPALVTFLASKVGYKPSWEPINCYVQPEDLVS